MPPWATPFKHQAVRIIAKSSPTPLSASTTATAPELALGRDMLYYGKTWLKRQFDPSETRDEDERADGQEYVDELTGSQKRFEIVRDYCLVPLIHTTSLLYALDCLGNVCTALSRLVQAAFHAGEIGSLESHGSPAGITTTKREKVQESARAWMARFTLFSGGALTLTDQPLLRHQESLKEAGGEDLEDYRQRACAASVKNRARTRYQKCAHKVAELVAHDAMMDAFVAEYDTQMAAKKLDAAKNLADDESDEDGAMTPLR
ncbi:hypothetical protein C8J57DRAFT_1239218 [Mycena rebaudengoi]|nr:hypothetical protein C8J57DRAFT_1239218 [Mycena rebaudengoi]